MADVDRNNNVSDNEGEHMKKSRFSAVLNFFNDIIGKTSSIPYGLDHSTPPNRRFSATLRRKKKQTSAPDISVSDTSDGENKHKKLAPKNSMPASLNLPRSRMQRPALSTNSFRQADVAEGWLRPTRHRSYKSNGSINYYQSDLSLDSLASSTSSRLNLTGGTLDRHTKSRSKNLSVRFSTDDLRNAEKTSMKRSYSNSADLRKPNQKEVDDALAVLKNLDENLKTQSEGNLINVGAFVCSVERSKNQLKPDNDEVFVEEPKLGKQDIAISRGEDKVHRDIHTEPAITVQIDHEKVFGQQNSRRRSSSSSSRDLKSASRNMSLAHRTNRTKSLSSESKDEGENNAGKLSNTNRYSSLELELNKTVIKSKTSRLSVPLDSETSDREELFTRTSSELLHECFDNSFWEDASIVSEAKIRDISENEARQVLANINCHEKSDKHMSKEITCNVRDKIRAYTGRNFKVIVNTLIGGLVYPSAHDTVGVTVKGLTDAKNDRFVVTAFEKDDMFISVTCVLIKIQNGTQAATVAEE